MARLRSIVSISLAIGGDDPVADLIENEEGVVQLLIEDFRPDDAGGARLGQLDRHRDALALALQRSADDVVDIQHPAGLFRTNAPLVQGKDGALRDDEQASQLGEPGDHVVGEAVGEPAGSAVAALTIDERHHRDGGAAGCSCDDGIGRLAACCGRRRQSGVSDLRPNCRLVRWLIRHASRIGAAVEAFGLEQPGRRREMLLALADTAAPGKRVQKEFVDAPVKRRELEPLLQIAERLVVGNASARDAPAGRRDSRGSGAAAPSASR